MIRIRHVQFAYPGAPACVDIRSLEIARGEKVAIVGPSGAGKTTLLKLMAGILKMNAGTIHVDGASLEQLTEQERRDFRITRIGFVFQELELLEYLNVTDNVLHTYRINPVLRLTESVRFRARALLEEVGIGEKYRHMPGALSQGERQRVAVCRALLADPSLILADEATGNLDPVNKVRIIDSLIRASETTGCTLVAVTHDHELLTRFDRVIDFKAIQAGAA